MAIQITLKINNLEQLQEVYKQAPKRMGEELNKAVARSVGMIVQAVKQEAPVSKASRGPGMVGGNLRQNVRGAMIGVGRGRVSSDAPYSGFVEFGTRPHVIEVKNKRVLAARTAGTRSGGQYAIFGRRVNHPGTKANPFFKRGVESQEKAINLVLANAAVRALMRKQ